MGSSSVWGLFGLVCLRGGLLVFVTRKMGRGDFVEEWKEADLQD